MSSERVRYRLRHVAENAEAIAGYLEGVTFAMFESDRKTRDACERCLERIIEAILKIGEADMHSVSPEIPFAAIRGLGNRLRHGYDAIKLPTLWDTLHYDIPPLGAACIEALEA